MVEESSGAHDDRCLATRLLLAGLFVLALLAFGWWTFLRPHQVDAVRPPSPPPPTPTVPRPPPWSPWEAGLTEVASIATGSFDDDGLPDVVACRANGELVALSGRDGSALWRFEAKSPLTAPAVADLDGDGREDVLVGTEDGRALAFAGDGSVLWIHRSLQQVFQVGAADIDRDGAADAVVAYPRGVKVLSGRTAMQIVLLEYTRPGRVGFALGDLDGDGTTDWVANHYDAQFNTRGVSGKDASMMWMRQTGEEVLSGPAIGDCDGDGMADCAYVSGSQHAVLILMGAKGSELRRWTVEGAAAIRPVLADVDGDGTVDVLVSASTWVKAVSGKDGSTLWSGPGLGFEPIPCDVEGDGTPECVVADAAGIAVRSARAGEELERLVPHELVKAPPVVADLDGDGRLEVVAAVEGRVRALAIPRK